MSTLPELLEALRNRLRSKLQVVKGAQVYRKLGSLVDAPAQIQRRGVALWVPSTEAGNSGNRDAEQVIDTLQVETSFRVGAKQGEDEGAALDFEQLVHASILEQWTGKPCNLVEFEGVQREVLGSIIFTTATFRVVRYRARVAA